MSYLSDPYLTDYFLSHLSDFFFVAKRCCSIQFSFNNLSINVFEEIDLKRKYY